MRTASLFVWGLLIAGAPTVPPASEAGARRIKVFVGVSRGEAGERGARVVSAALAEWSLFQIVREPDAADLFLESTARFSDIPAELLERLPPQPCYVLVSHKSLLMLPGSVSTHAPTCVEAGRRAIRGLAAQLLRRPDPWDGSI